MRELTALELENVSFLVANDVPHGALQPTAVALQKKIIDATEPFRDFLIANAIHDYSTQMQGQDAKVTLPTLLLSRSGEAVKSRASLYRPNTKSGDPRIWFSRLGEISQPNEIVVVMWLQGRLVLVNVSQGRLAERVRMPGALHELLSAFVERKSDSVGRLLDLLRNVAAKGFIPAPVAGPTAVGRLLESELGIAINSSKEPDFEGIELKASRGRSRTRQTLFAQVPDWQRSPFKSSRQLLDAFGYERDGQRKLSCSVSARKANSQGLSMAVDDKTDKLCVSHHSVHDSQPVVQWDLELLRYRLSSKHNETFWVKAETKVINGWEHIKFESAVHTKRPILLQLSPMLADGAIEVDFLIRPRGDKGYLFKVWPRDLERLFPPPTMFSLAP